MSELLSCPFCGRDTAIASDGMYVCCGACGCKGPYVTTGPRFAIAAWNRRAQPEPAAAAVACVTECEACFTPDACQLRGKCDHYSAEQLRVAKNAAPSVAPEPVEMRPYNPTEAMRWAAKRIDPALPQEHIRSLWCAMWSACTNPPRAPLTDEWIDGLIERTHFDKRYVKTASDRVCLDWYRMGIRDAERAHGISAEGEKT